MRKPAPVLAPLFRSEAQANLLAELLLPDLELSLTDLATRAGIPYPTVHREAMRLLSSGLLTDRRVGNTRLFRGNSASPLLAPVKQILLVSAGPVALLKPALVEVPGIDCAFLFGSFAARANGIEGHEPQDIDLMVVGAVDGLAVFELCQRLSDQVGRLINPTIFTPTEWATPSAFLHEVAANPVIELIGDVRSWLSLH